jgi:gluconolactonase
MKTPASAALIAALAGSILSATAQTNNEMPSVVEPGAKVEKLAGDLGFAEGPSCDAHGNVFFTDQPNDRILEWSTDGKLSTFKHPAGRANGMFFDTKGNLIACADDKTALWSIAPDGKETVIIDSFDGKKLCGPNDVWVAPNGSMYLTDPFYARPWWDYKTRPQDVEAVYYLSPDHKTFKRVITDYQKPNGIIGSPDGKTLYVADIQARKTYGYDIQADGSLTNKRLAANSGSDGMTMDTEGNLYLTSGYGVQVFDKSAEKIGSIPVTEMPANVCFGGKDKKTLFICARTGFYSVRIKYAGANAAK